MIQTAKYANIIVVSSLFAIALHSLSDSSIAYNKSNLFIELLAHYIRSLNSTKSLDFLHYEGNNSTGHYALRYIRHSAQ